MVLYSTTHASSEAWASAIVANSRSCTRTHSARIVLWNRSTFPVVVGDRGAVNKCRTPFSMQTRSNNTGPGPGPNRAVNTFPLSVKIPSGTPCLRIAAASASHTGRAVARTTSFADTQKRE